MNREKTNVLACLYLSIWLSVNGSARCPIRAILFSFAGIVEANTCPMPVIVPAAANA